ncbi:MAG: hypothetical protein WAU36_07985 [Cyclobacteriaceae bacterium]
MKKILLITILISQVLPLVAQKGKIPKGTKLSGWQTGSVYKGNKCEVCHLEETLPNGEKTYYFYDVKMKKKHLPEGSEWIEGNPKRPKGSAVLIFKTKEGKKMLY